MYKRLTNFQDINNLIFSLQFGFQQTHSTIHALINVTETESIRQTLNEGSFGCSIFLDLQKTFGTVDHKILRHKLDIMESLMYLMTGLSLTCQIVNNLFPTIWLQF